MKYSIELRINNTGWLILMDDAHEAATVHDAIRAALEATQSDILGLWIDLVDDERGS